MINSDGWGWLFILLAIVCGFIGWAVIESLSWLFSHITITWKW